MRPLLPIAVAALLVASVRLHAAPLAAPELIWHDGAGHETRAAALDLRIESKVTGLVAETTVHERFRNGSAGFLEGQYRLPLPEGAAVFQLRLHIGERVIEGEVREKAQAQAQYRAAASQGQRASLVEQEKTNLFRTAVANVAPGETVEVEVAYWQQVGYRDGRFALHLPLANPATYSQQLEIGTPDAGPATLTGTLADQTAQAVRIDVDLSPGVPLSGVDSDSHKIAVTRSADHYVIHALDADSGSARDFSLIWTPAPSSAPGLGLFVEHRSDGDYALAMVLPPTQAKERAPRELILVIDTSGSMNGTSIGQAKAALGLALDRLRPGDRFNVIEFNSVTRQLFPQPVDVGPETLDTARVFVERLAADGGTEMLPALDAALAGTPPPGYLRQVVFVTDGEVSQEDGLYLAIEQSLGEARLFPVGLGDAPNAHFMTQAARMGRGSPMMIRRIEDVAARMGELFDKLDRPALREVKLDWPGLADAYPSRLPDLYHDEPLLVVARLNNAKGALSAHGRLKSADWTRSVDLAQRGAAPGIARLWAARKIEELQYQMGRSQTEEQLQPQIVELAIAHHLVTRYTSLVAVDKTPVRGAAQALNGIDVGDADRIAFARGATAAPTLALVGIAGLLLLAFGLRLPIATAAGARR